MSGEGENGRLHSGLGFEEMLEGGGGRSRVPGFAEMGRAVGVARDGYRDNAHGFSWAFCGNCFISYCAPMARNSLQGPWAMRWSSGWKTTRPLIAKNARNGAQLLLLG
jgi:hypothetical protein